MNPRLKVFVILLAIIAGLSVFALVSRLRASVAVNNQLNSNIAFTLSPDTDSDGLSDSDESYWNTDFRNPDTDGDGFLDGEEVASGHSPTKKGPDDLLGSIKREDSETVTKKLIDRILGGLYSRELSADASDQNYFDAVDKVSLAVVYDGLNSLAADTSQYKFTTIAQSPVSDKKYVNNLIEIIEKNLIKDTLADPFILSNATKDIFNDDGTLKEDKLDFVKKFGLSRASNMRTTISRLQSLEVPAGWVGTHQRLIQVVLELYMSFDSLANIDNDPVKALIATGTFKNTYLKFPALFREINDQINLSRIKIDNVDFIRLIRSLSDD